VTIIDLPAGTTVTGVEFFEAAQTVSGVGKILVDGQRVTLGQSCARLLPQPRI
jgi:hypothetical protein